MNVRHYSRMLLAAAAMTTLALIAGLAPAIADEPVWEAPARAARKTNPVVADEASLASGKAVFAKECLQCHGASGKGDGPAAKDLKVKPKNLDDEAVGKQSDGALFWKLTEGRAPMPSYDKTLSETERWQVIRYVRSLGKN